uniref:Metalloendopeptidase n=1 Tax=Parastrongyloides trichosuri TaxID=131310 RepID=A0A0N4ZTU2_PARTI
MIGNGPKDKTQDVSIGRGCEMAGIVQHETLHALGFFHEQSRPDRDQYLTIALNNVASSKKHNYQIHTSDESDTLGIPYNYGSAMQYDKKAFASNNQVVMITKNKLYQDSIGNKARLAFLDFKAVNKAYCSKKCKGGVKCSNGGYEDPNKCGVCKCPYLLTGKTCTEYIQNKSPGCGGKSVITLSSSPVTVKPKGKIECVYTIKASGSKKIKITFGKANQIARGEACYANDALEIQYLNDKTLGGVFKCGQPKGSITSEGPLMLVKYNGQYDFNFAELTFSTA